MPHSILLVDDDESLSSLLEMMLKRAGYTAYTAGDASEALEFTETTLPDLFIVDVMMPGMNGFELTQALRAKPETAQHPIILLSARTDQASMFEGLEAGANLYLFKPIAPKDLIARIAEYLKSPSRDQESESQE